MKLRSILFKSLPSHGNRKLNSMLQAQACSRFNCIGFSVSYAFGSMIIILTHVFVCVCVVVHTLTQAYEEFIAWRSVWERELGVEKQSWWTDRGKSKPHTHSQMCMWLLLGCGDFLQVEMFNDCQSIWSATAAAKALPHICLNNSQLDIIFQWHASGARLASQK